jgi:hypothetical protein
MEDKQGIPSYIIYIGIFVVVFVVALGAFLYSSQSKAKDFTTESYKYKPTDVDNANASTDEITPSPAAQNEALKITIATPEDNSFVNTNSLKVAGASKPGTTITITGGAKDVVGEANSDGSFALDTALKEGENQLTITVYDQAGQQKTVTKTVYALVEG